MSKNSRQKAEGGRQTQPIAFRFPPSAFRLPLFHPHYHRGFMKKLLALALLLCAYPALAAIERADALSLQLTMTRGERSKDSNSSTTEITINGETLVYRKTYSGRSRGRMPEETKEFKLAAEDKKNLIKLIKDRKLLRTESIERAQAVSGMYLYFELSVKSTVDKSTGSISIKGSRKATDLKEEKLYQDAVALIEEIYAIIRRTDERVVYEPLIP